MHKTPHSPIFGPQSVEIPDKWLVTDGVTGADLGELLLGPIGKPRREVLSGRVILRNHRTMDKENPRIVVRRLFHVRIVNRILSDGPANKMCYLRGSADISEGVRSADVG